LWLAKVDLALAALAAFAGTRNSSQHFSPVYGVKQVASCQLSVILFGGRINGGRLISRLFLKPSWLKNYPISTVRAYG